ncbi:ribosome maturation factor RimP [candidate division KSB1 bacterium]|nr:ribosome maturation factor RimP [candidate division KSB1 bacterium]
MVKLEEIKSLILPILERENVELVDMELFGRGPRTILRIYVHEEGGIGLDRCAYLSRQFSDILDRKDPFSSRYTLQVSSPGVDRPLVSERDFQRNTGRKVEVFYMEKDGTTSRLTGRVVSAFENHIGMETEQGEIRLNLEQIQKAKIIIEF